MNDWLYSPDWSEKELLDGSSVGFVYLFQFEDGTFYLGVKQIWKGVRDSTKLKGNEKENGWREYKSSSKKVQVMVDSGMNYTRTILWGFETMTEANYVESFLILTHSLDENILNMAMMNKCRIPTGTKKRKLRGIIQTIEGWL
ncbi:hypothetical protein E0539_11720 [Salmonella enterica subsp. enterica serovar Tilene]|uniref:hypothetical protein n=1 Tax=Salmonella enterica TaxID=28901 RepID=UPI00128A19B1|nr:hypothetical protein [Salmonella enterica]EAW1312589.1 hypothetical protein [Salmonella enterica subsp. enterica]EBZ5874342.1 hypothetical protein [Salmonella enterica subsp. enterica serovar Millesi]ECF1326702.1 hypothetical protein [Salmonella enterica subsp. enterica serovar Tilene]EEL5713505.1 hypothetical protein [Salmonella enterica subsp. enterica serovar Rubislaw]EBE4781719.1 hypothetical protein [Salmonella enterica]